MHDIQRLQNILSEQVIPHIASSESLRMITARHPLRLPDGVTITRRAAPPLKINRNNRSNLFLARYPEEGMHAIRYPYLCYVVEGEIDMRLGIPAKSGKGRGTVRKYETLTLPAHSALLIPPGVFFPDGKSTYWERPQAPVDAQIFWIHILPSGIFCHTSSTRDAVYGSDNLDVFVPEQHFATLIDLFEKDLQFGDAEAFGVPRNTLLTFFSRVAWKLGEGTQANLAFSAEEERGTDSDHHSLTIRRALDFIRKHNNTAFTVEEVAAYAYVSPSHLMRLFRTELQTTVMDYVLAQRMSYAETWLQNSEMPIKQIASILGYSQAPQFNRIFKQIYGTSPTEFRRRRQHPKI